MSDVTTTAVVVGAGFAGAATAWALTRAGVRDVVVLEREDVPGYHASGRNAAMLRVTEPEPTVRRLAFRALRTMRTELEEQPGELFHHVGGVLMARGARADALAGEIATYREDGLRLEQLSEAAVHSRFPSLRELRFDAAIWAPDDGVIDIHGLLLRYLDRARAAGATVRLGITVEELLIEGGRVRGVVTASGTIRADVVVDAAGAWAGTWGTRARLPLQPLRRHLVVSGALPGIDPDAPFAWHLDAGFYLRPEGEGLLLSPCDESPHPPGEPVADPAALELLHEKLRHGAPELAERLTVRSSWACLRTFAPDRHPVVGFDEALPGLFHVSGLGGFGVCTSAAAGELAAALVTGERPDWIDLDSIAPRRLAAAPIPAGGP